MWVQYARYQFLSYVFLSVEPLVKCSFLQKRINNTTFEESNLQGASNLEQTNILTIATGATDIGPGSCQTSVCTVNIASVSLYVWPQEIPSTDCLATVPSPPQVTVPPKLNPVSPNVYAVFYSMTISDGCRQIFYGNHTASFAPEELSTFALHATSASAFDYAHVNCPPSSVVSDIEQPYAPVVSPPPSFISRLDFLTDQHCNEWMEIRNWTDPIAFLSDAKGGTSPVLHEDIAFLPGSKHGVSPARPKHGKVLPVGSNGGHHRLRRDPATAHNTPRAPASTMMPS